MSNSVQSTDINKKWLDIMLTGCTYLFVWFLEYVIFEPSSFSVVIQKQCVFSGLGMSCLNITYIILCLKESNNRYTHTYDSYK